MLNTGWGGGGERRDSGEGRGGTRVRGGEGRDSGEGREEEEGRRGRVDLFKQRQCTCHGFFSPLERNL